MKTNKLLIKWIWQSKLKALAFKLTITRLIKHKYLTITPNKPRKMTLTPID